MKFLWLILLTGCWIRGGPDDVGRSARPWSNVDDCRFDPTRCLDAPGGFCDDDDDCARSLHCCDDKQCGGGMCTYDCDDDRDCPGNMRCEHSVCFYACSSDQDCAAGMECKHDNTVCEWD